MRFQFIAGLLLAACLSIYPVSAQQAAYLDERPTKKLAFVVGNSDYAHHATIPSSAVDAQQVKASLEKLGFTVFTALNVGDSAEFWNVHFLPFRSKISEDDFVLFYFSGHGFSYGGENFVVMTQAEKSLPESKALDVLVAAGSIRELISVRKPGLTMLILDACRTIGGNIVKLDGTEAAVDKGPSLVSTLADNVLIGFSSDLGKVSKGRDEPSKMSYYTEALLDFLGEEDKEFQYVKKQTRLRTIFNTKSEQVPWFSESSSAEVYFKPSPATFDGERTVWTSRLRTNDPQQVWNFMREYPTSRYVNAARKWLDDFNNKPKEARTTKIPPILLDYAWSNDSTKPVSVPRIDGPFGFNKISIAERLSGLPCRSCALVSKGNEPENFGIGSAEILASQGRLMVTRSLSARISPDENSRSSELIQPGSTIDVSQITADAAGKAWLKITGESGGAYLPADRANIGLSAIGFSLKEIEAEPSTRLESLVDEDIIRRTVSELRAAGRSISRVSLSVAPTKDERQSVKRSGRVAHALLVLEQSGVSRDAMTAVSSNVVPDKESVRIRFFGN